MADESTDRSDRFRLNNKAIRLWQLDMALQHLTRNQGVLGLGSHAMSQSLRAEKDELVEELKLLGEEMVPVDQRPARRSAA